MNRHQILSGTTLLQRLTERVHAVRLDVGRCGLATGAKNHVGNPLIMMAQRMAQRGQLRGGVVVHGAGFFARPHRVEHHIQAVVGGFLDDGIARLEIRRVQFRLVRAEVGGLAVGIRLVRLRGKIQGKHDGVEPVILPALQIGFNLIQLERAEIPRGVRQDKNRGAGFGVHQIMMIVADPDPIGQAGFCRRHNRRRTAGNRSQDNDSAEQAERQRAGQRPARRFENQF